VELTRVIDKIKKMIRHRDSAAQIGSQAEAEHFAATIHRLAEEYDIALSEINLEDQTTGENGVINRMMNFKETWGADLSKGKSEGVPKWCSHLMGNLTHYHGCKSIINAEVNLCVIGPAVKVELITYLFLTLGRTARRLCSERSRHLRRLYGTAGPKFEENFLMGFVAGIGARLREREEEAKRARDAGCTALVLRTEKAIDEVIERDFGKVTNGAKYKGPSNSAAYMEGIRHGLTADIDAGGINAGAEPAQLKH